MKLTTFFTFFRCLSLCLSVISTILLAISSSVTSYYQIDELIVNQHEMFGSMRAKWKLPLLMPKDVQGSYFNDIRFNMDEVFQHNGTIAQYPTSVKDLLLSWIRAIVCPFRFVQFTGNKFDMQLPKFDQSKVLVGDLFDLNQLHRIREC